MSKSVIVAMSGGVDSSVTVRLLLDEGYEVSGATMHLYDNENIGVASRTCCSLRDVEDAKSAALKLGVELRVFEMSGDFRERVIDPFVEDYLTGFTPNPCIECNKHLKFGSFLKRARLLGADYIATGHYVRRSFDENTGRWLLLRAADRAKDQSYVLYGMTQEQLAHTLFPVGDMTKTEIRAIAEEQGLINANKPDSQDICFIPGGDYASFIELRAGAQKEGDIVLSDGTLLGRHRGLIHYTIGQRRGLGVSYSEPLFVIGKDMKNSRLILGTAGELYSGELLAEEVNIISIPALPEGLRCTAQTRYHQKDVPCTVYPAEGGRMRVVFDAPHKAVAPGQAVVLYDGDVVIGGGRILTALPAKEIDIDG